MQYPLELMTLTEIKQATIDGKTVYWDVGFNTVICLDILGNKPRDWIIMDRRNGTCIQLMNDDGSELNRNLKPKDFDILPKEILSHLDKEYPIRLL